MWSLIISMSFTWMTELDIFQQNDSKLLEGKNHL